MYHTQMEHVTVPTHEVEVGSDEHFAQQWPFLPLPSKTHIARRNPVYFAAVNAYWVAKRRKDIC